MRYLQHPAKYERLHPNDVPDDLEHFGAWANHACIEWPVALQRDAFKAYEALSIIRSRLLRLSFKIEDAYKAFDKFIENYRRWYLLTEHEKDRASPSKDEDYRRKHRELSRRLALSHMAH